MIVRGVVFGLGLGIAIQLQALQFRVAHLDSVVAGFLDSNCVKCHGPNKAKGKVRLHDLDGDLSREETSARWESVLNVLKSGEMPPEEEESRPLKKDADHVIKWIEAELRKVVEQNKEISVPPVVARRLTNFEYQNTMRDLLGFELELSKDLPNDPVKPYHFNNTAEMMLIGPDQLVRYKEAARKAMTSAIVDPQKPASHRISREWNHGALGKGGLSQAEIGVYQGPGVGRKTIGLKSWPKTGEFCIRVKASGNFPSGFKEVALRLVIGTDLRHDSGTGIYHEVGTVHLTNTHDKPEVFEFRGRIENVPVQPARKSKNRITPPSITITAQNIFDNGELNDHRKSAFDASWSEKAPRVILEMLEFEAPVTEVWPPEHHTRILFESPERESSPERYARKVIKRFMTRAFRRPVLNEEVDRFYSVYQIYRGEFETLEEAMRETLATVLISPHFLYHTSIADNSQSKQYELASRLSYFLWGSMPDQQLFDLADTSMLHDPKVIEAQARRLLADKRANDFIENFTLQWLSIAKMKTVNINQDIFPRFLYTVHVGERRGQEQLFRPTIRDYMLEETTGFVAELIRNNMSAMNVVDSDFAYLNQPLAVHYGVEGVEGLKLRTVKIDAEHRLGGLLTQGSVLLGNSTGSAPHPIYRAVWLREAILGQEVKPPPAEVPALSDSAGDSAEEAVTIKDLLALHRNNESCRDCHVRLDPWGIPFERYNAIGKYQPFVPKEKVRVRGVNMKLDQSLSGYRKYLESVYTEKVEASSGVPLGPIVDGMEDLKAYLLKDRKSEIAENMIRRLMTYGMGRSLSYLDRFDVEKLLEEAEGNGYKLQDMIISVCLSPSFTSAGRGN